MYVGIIVSPSGVVPGGFSANGTTTDASSVAISPRGAWKVGSSVGDCGNEVSGNSGALNTSSGGSFQLTGAEGEFSSRLPHRARIMLLPSVITFSPCSNRSFFFV
ncbi:MAG TPA: hypothetical protein VGM51_03730 [Armatimonadota bacterium]|jgi:hypothetical protein